MSIWRVTLTGTMYNQKMQNVLHFDNPENIYGITTMRNYMVNDWILMLRTIQNVNFTWTSLQLAELKSNPEPPYVEALSGMPGGLSGPGAPPFVCGVFSIRTSTGGRRGRGRFYMGGVHQESILNGQLHPNALIAYSDVANQLKIRFCTGGSTDFRLQVAERVALPDGIPSTNIVARGVLGVQRRRNINVGI